MSLTRDLRHGLRTLGRTPGLVFVSIVTLGLGIGANTAIFSVIHSVLLKPLVFPEPDRIVQTWMAFPERNADRASWSHGHFWDARERVSTFEDLAAVEFGRAILTGRGDPVQLDAVRVNAGFFRVLRVPLLAGRTLTEQDERPGGAAPVAMLSHRFWTRLGQDRGLVGQTFVLDGVAHEIVGILPPGTPFLDAADVFRPLPHVTNGQRGSWELAGIGRLKPGVTLDAARADLVRVMRALGEQHASTSRGMSASIAPLGDLVTGANTRRALWVLLGAVGLLLLVACVNLTNLLLAKAAGRAREMALRSALGASRGHIVRLLLAESLLLTAAGTAAGLLLAIWAVDLLRAGPDWGIARLDEVTVDGSVLAFTAIVAATTGLLTGLVPALQASRGDLAPALRDGDRAVAGSPRQMRLRAVLVASEVAITLALLVGAGLLLRSLAVLLTVDRGFHTEQRLLVEVSLPPAYAENEGRRAGQFVLDFGDRLRHMPQVLSAAAVSGRPMSPGSTGMGIVAGERREETSDIPWATWRLITGDYFKTMGVPLLRGRTFLPTDVIAKPWRVVVSQRLAEELWPGQNPIGRRAILWRGQGNRDAEVIGVVGNMRERGLAEPPTLAVYLPIYGTGADNIQFAVHTTASTDTIVPALRAVLSSLDPQLPLANVETLEAIVRESTSARRFTVLLLSAFASLALVLALVGIYGVLSYTVSRQVPEIGVRMALGASQGGVLRHVLRQGLTPVAFGIGVGLVGAFLLSRFIATLLFGVTTFDPITYVGVASLLGLTAVVACVVPARQAMRVDVVSALRAE